MSKIRLQNIFFEEELNVVLEKDRIKFGFKSKSQLLRHIIKERYHICLKDSCTSVALRTGLCSYHFGGKAKDKELQRRIIDYVPTK